jgi:hypothetical protein
VKFGKEGLLRPTFRRQTTHAAGGSADPSHCGLSGEPLTVKEQLTLREKLGRFFWLIGPVALIAWFGLIYLIFGDVL